MTIQSHVFTGSGCRQEDGKYSLRYYIEWLKLAESPLSWESPYKKKNIGIKYVNTVTVSGWSAVYLTSLHSSVLHSKYRQVAHLQVKGTFWIFSGKTTVVGCLNIKHEIIVIYRNCSSWQQWKNQNSRRPAYRVGGKIISFHSFISSPLEQVIVVWIMWLDFRLPAMQRGVHNAAPGDSVCCGFSADVCYFQFFSRF